MKGVELVAGSIPTRFITMGSIAPTVHPAITMPMSVQATVKAKRKC